MIDLFWQGFAQRKADVVFGLAMLMPCCIVAASVIVAYVIWERRGGK